MKRACLVLWIACAIVACGENTPADDGMPTAGTVSMFPTAGTEGGFAGTPAAGTPATAGTGVAGIGVAGDMATAGIGAAGVFSEAGTGAGTLAADGGMDTWLEYEPTLDIVSKVGPYKVGTVSDVPTNSAYNKATIQYPTDAEPPYALVALIPGYTESVSASISWLGPRLASHGFAVVSINPLDLYHCPEPRATQLMAGLETLAAENTRPESPLFGKLDMTKRAVGGHSMGGGASLIASAAHSDLKASIPLTPWSGGAAPCTGGGVGPISFPTVTVPTLIVGGKGDAIAPENTFAYPEYTSLPDATPKAYMEFNEGGHNAANNRNSNEVLLTRYIVSWLHLFMNGDERYRAFISGPNHDATKSMFSRFESEF